MTTLTFRNVGASPDDPVAQWPQEAIQAALERGTSTSRLSTYATGKVTPSAALLVRMRRMTE